MLRYRLVLLGIMVMFTGLVLGQKVVQLPAISDTDALHGIVEAVNNSDESDVIELTTSGGMYVTNEHSVIKISKPITIRAAEGLAEKPIIQNTNPDASTRILFEIVDGGSLTLIGLELDGLAGTETNCKYLIRTDDDAQEGATGISVLNPYKLKVIDCYLHDVVKGSDGNFFRAYKYTFADSVIFRDCVFDNCGKEGIRLKDYYDLDNTGFYQAKYVEISNCTFSNTVNEALVVYAGDNEPLTMAPKVLVNHCTFYNCGNNGTRVVNAWDCDGAEVKNSIFASSPNNDFSVKLYGETSTIHHCDAYNVGEFQMTRNAVLGDGMMYVDPEFTNSWNLDFTLTESSPLLGKADDGTAMGDLRWDPNNTGVDFMDPLVKSESVQLYNNFPNPFNPNTVISYQLSVFSNVQLDVYNAAGQHLKTLFSGKQAAGYHQFDFDGSSLSSGIYIYQLKGENFLEKKNMLLIK